MYGKLVVLLVILGVTVDVAFGCNGYKLNVIKIENCVGDAGIITVDQDFGIKLNKKCELVPRGCVSNKAFATATATYTLKKDKVVMKEGELDLCEAADEANAEAKSYMKVFSMPSKCPVEEEKICANEHRLDLSKFKNMLSMAKGTFVLDVEIKHDTGKSCLHVEVEVTK